MENVKTEEQSTIQEKKPISLENVILSALKIPGIKINRNDFLREQFKFSSPKQIQLILEKGPVEAGVSEEKLRRIATRILNSKTMFSTTASFVAGLPGGLAMTVSIPADLLQFYAVALQLAQEVAYLYGQPDLWSGEFSDNEQVVQQLMIYCGVMLGANGANQAVRVLSSNLAKQALKKLPQKALTKTIYYPIIKSIAKFFGVKMTKDVFAKGVSKAIPIIGGVVSGGITLATFRPMGLKLINALEMAQFSYTQEDFESDWNDIMDENQNSDIDVDEKEDVAEFNEVEIIKEEKTDIKEEQKEDKNNILEKIKEAKQLLDMGIIDEEEFSKIKEKLISQL